MPQTSTPKSATEIRAAIAAQDALCRAKGLPLFAPDDGRCFGCARQIYDVLDGRSHVTGCPFCMRSFCD